MGNVIYRIVIWNRRPRLIAGTWSLHECLSAQSFEEAREYSARRTPK